MKKLLSLILIAFILVSAVGCDSGDLKYSEKYSAKGLIRSNKSDSCKVSFATLDGTLVFKLSYTSSAEGKIYYYASIAQGEVQIYYDSLGAKEHLFRAQATYPIEGEGGYIERGNDVYLIIEADEAVDGFIEISLGK